MRIHKGDQVNVLSGKDKGKKGEVVRAIPAQDRVIVEGVNVAKRHAKPTRGNHAGRRHRQVHAGPRLDGGMVCAECGPTRIGFRIDDQGRKVRVCRKCGADL